MYFMFKVDTAILTVFSPQTLSFKKLQTDRFILVRLLTYLSF